MKRLTDTDKWTNNRWFQRLPKDYKLLWMYIWDVCDNVGVWSADLERAMLMTSGTLKEDEALDRFGSRIEILDEETKTWWVVEFCEFQHPDLIEYLLDEQDPLKPSKDLNKYRALKSYVRLLEQHRLTDRVLILYTYSTGTSKVRQGKVGLGKVGEKKKEYAPTVHMTPDEYDKLVKLIGKDNTRRCIDKISHYKGALGKTYKDDYKAILNWTVKEVTGKDPTDWEADKERKQEEERKHGEKKQELRTREPIPPGERERLQLIAGNIGKSPEDKT